jgi:protein involved in ribonucleotide reduction
MHIFKIDLPLVSSFDLIGVPFDFENVESKESEYWSSRGFFPLSSW